jgi:hypothetical protein
MMRTPLSIAIGFVVPALVACASAPAQQQPVADPIIVPDDATEVDHIDFFTQQRELIRLNQRMLILRSGVRPYLVVFNETCLNLKHPDPRIAYRTKDESALYARSDVLLVDGAPCQVDRIYAITSEDEVALREQIRP